MGLFEQLPGVDTQALRDRLGPLLAWLVPKLPRRTDNDPGHVEAPAILIQLPALRYRIQSRVS